MTKTSFRVLGVDPGSSVTGYGVVTAERHILDFGAIRPPRNERLSLRRKVIFEGIDFLIRKYEPHAMAVESQFVRHNPRSAIVLGMVTGIVTLAATLHNIPIFQYPPSLPKRAVGAGGRASKRQVQEMVQRIFRLSELPTPEDAADALAIALCHIHASEGALGSGEEI